MVKFAINEQDNPRMSAIYVHNTTRVCSRAVGDKLTSIVHKMDPLIATGDLYREKQAT